MQELPALMRRGWGVSASVEIGMLKRDPSLLPVQTCIQMKKPIKRPSGVDHRGAW